MLQKKEFKKICNTISGKIFVRIILPQKNNICKQLVV